MTFWAKSLRVFNCLWEHGTQSVRRIAHKTQVQGVVAMCEDFLRRQG